MKNGKSAVGIKNLTYNEPIFEGHFPAQPVMPGVLQVEALAQLGAWLLLQEIGEEDQLGYFRSISKATFRKTVIPGDQLRLEIEIVQRRSTLARITGECMWEMISHLRLNYLLRSRLQKTGRLINTKILVNIF